MYIRLSLFTAFLTTSAVYAQPPFGDPSELVSRLESAIRSQSEASNRPSMAMIDRETARSMNYDNQLKHVRTYFEKRKLNREYRAAERGPSPTHEQIVATAKSKAPDRMSVRQYDPYTGQISWPVALRQPVYQKGCQYMDRLFDAHARAGGGIDTDYYSKIYSSLDKFQELLSKNYQATNPQQWCAAKKFLESLQYEARFPTGA